MNGGLVAGPDPEVRLEAVQALGALRSDEAVPVLRDVAAATSPPGADPASTVSTIAGPGGAGSTTPGFSGEYVTSIAATMSTPWGIVFSSGHLFVADSGNNALRVIW